MKGIRPHLVAALLLCGALAACEAEPQAPFVPPDEGPITFDDARPARDGLVVVEDAFLPPTRDAAIRTEAGVCTTGDLIGVACAPGGQALAGAQVVAVTTDCFGQPREVQVVADQRGRFRLSNLAPGPAEVNVRLGSFFARYQAEVVGGTARPVNGESEKVCLPADATRMAVLTGDFDRIQAVIDGLGFEYDLICGDRGHHRPARQLLADRERLGTYDILFVNCTSGIDLGHTDADVQQALANLRWFVRQGGSLYVSDLSADFVRRGWPGFVSFLASQSPAADGEDCCVCADCPPACSVDPPAPPRDCEGCCDDPNPLPAQCNLGNGTGGRGSNGQIEAVVPSEFLAHYLNTDRLTVNFNLSAWVQIAEVAAGVEVLVADGAGQPLMVLFEPEPGGGRVAFTSFHNHAQATDAMLGILEALIFRL
ncbi:MAG: carboxypeptidase regulatory-like domain-containing protein [Myxococcales bacterium]|nr:carboxypeptidase regulatory-like domain-containing protein [Myxococcales bacterium]MCB9522417.1 carboxypeptidase regulatory-like domain-containing protein [Myxococcales bacterium]